MNQIQRQQNQRERAFNNGLQAGHLGLAACSNPYPSGTQRHQAWEEGHKQGWPSRITRGGVRKVVAQ